MRLVTLRLIVAGLGGWIERVRVVMLWLMCCPQGLRQYQQRILGG
jgi:hypothetical protein